MILDQLQNAAWYFGAHERLTKALRYLQNTELSHHASGRYEIEGNGIFMLVQEYETKPREKGFWEAHRQYMDIQYVASGVELMGYANLNALRVDEYDESRDFVPAFGEGMFFEMHAGAFAIFAPQDAHMPGIAVGEPQPVRKIVMKVRV
jgi:YhcH/YjgK/YiaL family protein